MVPTTFPRKFFCSMVVKHLKKILLWRILLFLTAHPCSRTVGRGKYKLGQAKFADAYNTDNYSFRVRMKIIIMSEPYQMISRWILYQDDSCTSLSRHLTDFPPLEKSGLNATFIIHRNWTFEADNRLNVRQVW